MALVVELEDEGNIGAEKKTGSSYSNNIVFENSMFTWEMFYPIFHTPQSSILL